MHNRQTHRAVRLLALSFLTTCLNGPAFAEPALTEVRVDPPMVQLTGPAARYSLLVQGKRAGTLIAFYRSVGRPSQHELRVVQEGASLVSAQVELSVVAAQEERLAQAELRALRAQISPHFIYNALAAVASEIHADPDQARELLT